MRPVTLVLNKDFKRLYYRGTNVVLPSVVIYFQKNRLGFNRYGITTSKKIGNAVARNRARRVIFEAYRNLLPKINTGYDFVFVARGKTVFTKSTAVQKALESALTKNGLMINKV